MVVSAATVFRVRGLPSHISLKDVSGIIERSLHMPSEISGVTITSLAEDFYQSTEQVATLSFLKGPPELFITAATSNEWLVHIIDADCDSTISRSRALKFDTHFRGLTVLNDPVEFEEAVDCVAVCGLGGHAFGSFKEKGTSYMWLRDSVPKYLPNLRILLYGYESGLEGSQSTLNISGIAETFIGHLRGLRSQSETISRPLIMIAHSLGGLVVKQAIIKLSRGGNSDKRQMQSIMGLIFFGVPNRGMDIESLRAMVGDQPNRYILESVGQYSDLLVEQDARFGLDFHYEDSPIFSFFELKSSPTAVKTGGSWRMAGDLKMLVGPFSAKYPRSFDPELHHEGFDRTHSDLVKFSIGDIDYERVLSRLSEIISKAKIKLTSRCLSQESPESLSTDEKACLRTLAFTEIHAREGRVESAAHNTGDWLLKSQDFQDWAQRKRLNEHHGFFWIQGNPGSGKSTLMKQAYSYIQALSRDPTSIIAAFFFNARGSEIERSPTGLFRTLLHTLYQHISALRDRVMRTYRRKCELLHYNWEWQFHELKELLSSVVTSSVLGQRNLILCVDALDECELGGAKSVVHFFEHLVSSSIRESTKFNVCLSSRYWPQFTIRHCFKTRVERENHGDIASFIQQHMETMRAGVNENNQLAALEKKLKNKANGTFLWVVLVLQELLTAYDTGATLGELDRILQRVPPDLSRFYQHQMENARDDDRHQMLSVLQCVFYSLKPLSPTELRYILAFGHESFSSYSEWAQSSEYVMSGAQIEKRIREKSKGLIEIAEIPERFNRFKQQYESKKIVQFIHQSVRDFFSKDGFKSLRGCEMPNDAASGHDFIKTACFNYLNTTDLKEIPIVDFRFYSDDGVRRKMPNLSEDHPLLEYAVDQLFPHAALAEGHGIQQHGLRSHMSDDIQGSFERWKYLNDLVRTHRSDRQPSCTYGFIPRSWTRAAHGPEAQPLHVFSQYDLLAPTLRKLDEDPNIEGGLYHYPLLAAAARGHKDVVRCLLNSGANLEVTNPQGETAYHWAVSRGHVDILKILLECPRSNITLRQRLKLASYARGDAAPYQESKSPPDWVHEILSLLIPEASLPVSAIDEIFELHDLRQDYSVMAFIHFILDKCEVETFQYQRLLHWCVANYGTEVPLIQRLLEGTKNLKFSEELLDALYERDDFSTNIDEVAMILFKVGDVEITEKFVDQVSLLSYSSQLLHRIAARGFELPPLTCRQTMSALSNGSPESVGFFIQHAPDDASSNEMLLAAVQNKKCGAQAVRVLLGLRRIDSVCEATVNSCLKNSEHSLSLLKTFEDRWGPLVLSQDALVAAAVSRCPLDVIKFVLGRCERFSVTESLVVVLLRETPYGLAPKLNLLLELDPNSCVQDEVIAESVGRIDAGDLLMLYLDHGKPLVLTEKVVRAAAHNHLVGSSALKIILQHTSGAKFSNTMVLEAMGSSRSMDLITLILESDPSISIQEEFLIAAASNPEQGALILQALYEEGRIDFGNLTTGDTHAPPTKRWKISSNRVPLPRDTRDKSAQITKKVIEAAAANDDEDQRRLLLFWFQKWGVLTEEDCRLFRFSESHSS